MAVATQAAAVPEDVHHLDLARLACDTFERHHDEGADLGVGLEAGHGAVDPVGEEDVGVHCKGAVRRGGVAAEVDQRVGSLVRACQQRLRSLVHVEGTLEPEELLRQPAHRRGSGVGVGILAQLREGLGRAHRAVRSDAEDDHRLRVLARVAEEHAAHAGVRDLRLASEALEDVLAIVAALRLVVAGRGLVGHADRGEVGEAALAHRSRAAEQGGRLRHGEPAEVGGDVRLRPVVRRRRRRPHGRRAPRAEQHQARRGRVVRAELAVGVRLGGWRAEPHAGASIARVLDELEIGRGRSRDRAARLVLRRWKAGGA